jgi:hypothetical protein
MTSLGIQPVTFWLNTVPQKEINRNYNVQTEEEDGRECTGFIWRRIETNNKIKKNLFGSR